MRLNGINNNIKSLIRVFLLSILVSGLFFVIPAKFTGMVILAFPTQTSDDPTYTYALPNYTVTYKIVKMPPPDSQSVNPYAYNIVVHGPPPFPIQIEFYQQNADNIIEKRISVMPTNSLSTSIGCTSYPTEITMMQVDNEPVSTTPTSNTSTDLQLKPSIPEFTVELFDNPYTLEVRIKNEPFNATSDANGTVIIGYYYRVRVNRYSEDFSHPSYLDHFSQSNTEYTVKSYLLEEGVSNIVSDGKLDVQIKAYVGELYRIPRAIGLIDVIYDVYIDGEQSEWSNTQTATVEGNTPTNPYQPTTDDTSHDEPTVDDTKAEEPTTNDTTTEDPITPQESTTNNEESYSLEQIAVILGIIATVISVAALGTGLLVYFKIRNIN